VCGESGTGEVNVNDVAQLVQSLINWPAATGLVVALGISAALVLIAIFLLLIGWRRWVASGIGCVGLATIMAVLLIVDQQTTTSRESDNVTVTRPRYRERTRTLARSAMIALPGVAVLVVVGAWASVRRRLRRSIPRLLKAGRMHLFLKEYEPALAEFGRAIRISPYLAEAYCGRGDAYQGLGDLERALADYDQAIEYDPRSTHAYIRRARIRTETGDCDGALADLNRVMEIQPSDPELYLNRGICFFKKGLMSDAAADFQRVLKLTNHSDFAEPAKDFLRQVDRHAAGRPFTSPLGPPQDNGAPDATALPDPRAKDRRI
jgi:tetratricopeptide (TPR) repeat protein